MSTTTATVERRPSVHKRLQARSGPGLNVRMASITLFSPIAKHRVSAKTPATSGDQLDVARCAALHNTLLLYGWVCSGKKIPDLQKKSWWSRNGSAALKEKLQPSLVQYLSKVFDVPGHNLFYHISGLSTPQDMLKLWEVLDDQDHDRSGIDNHRYIVIYNTSKTHVTHPAGIVYDQHRHEALLMPTYNHMYDLHKADLPWQKLESILSAWIDMVEAEKAVAVHDSVGTEDDASPPQTGVSIGSSRLQYKTRPWVLQPYTAGDLNSCLEAWQRLITAIEKRAETPPPPTDEPEPLVSRAALNIAKIPKGFAYALLSRMPHTPIWFLAPGIRLPKVEEFIHQPFKPILSEYPEETANCKMPFLFLRCPGTVSAAQAKFRYPFSTLPEVPCGLYLDAFPNALNPFEDACRLVLPIRLGENKYARTSDFKPIRKSYSDLYQTSVNPFVIRHGPKLVDLLENWLEHVERGYWTVNEKGVVGGVGKWRDADTRENWWRYQSRRLCI